MEQYQWKFITANLTELQEMITCTVELRSYLKSKGILTSGDDQRIQAGETEMLKTERLLEILKAKDGSFQKLTDAVDYCKQSGAAKILRRCPTKDDLEPPASTQAVAPTTPVKKRERVTLHFGDAEMDSEVLPKTQADLIRQLKTDASNLKIIQELNSLAFFDQDAIKPLLSSRHDTQQKRMTELFNLISELDDDEIHGCLERLCTLKIFHQKCPKRYRKFLKSIFPDACALPLPDKTIPKVICKA